jgi:hypothetical protein
MNALHLIGALPLEPLSSPQFYSVVYGDFVVPVSVFGENIMFHYCSISVFISGVSIPLDYMSLFISVPHSFDYYSFVIIFYVRKCESSNFVLFKVLVIHSKV